uniref:Triple gene block 1 protein n=1 Tax=Passiflora latent virus TaxID=379892 RepID=A0A8F2FBK1_9VIRU|nr:triple gene block 1 protein [Passiflora latent virus]UZP17296.1 Triple gene block 1 Protein [Passiflora latent virus]
MDVLVSYLNKYKFVRLCSNITPPIIIHSVPGAGKSSLIREIIRADSRFVAYTQGRADPVSVEGVQILKQPATIPSGASFVLIDEYVEKGLPEGVFAAFADPLQGGSGRVLRAHFIKTESHRFGKCTAQLLRELDFSVTAYGEDLVQISGIYDVDPRDTVIYFEPEVGNLLAAHSIEAFCIEEIRGQTFESVTFVTSQSTPIDRAKAFQCLTRHRKSLLILCPDATYTAA